MKLWLIPIEPIPFRYTEQWARWWPAKLRERGWDVSVIDGAPTSGAIGKGEFLDCFETNAYKASQVSMLANLFAAGSMQDDDVIFFLDGWHFGVHAAAYMRDVSGVDVKLASYFHAGTWDPHDHLTRKGVGKWAKGFEQSLFDAIDIAFVASYSHAKTLPQIDTTLRVVGMPIVESELEEFAKPWDARLPIVTFPHRLAPEKQPEYFDRVRAAYEARYPGELAYWIKTVDHAASKDDYYRLLGQSKVVFSSALQETWGIAMHEGAALGCHPVAPNRLCYPEQYPGSVYSGTTQAVELIHAGLHADTPFVYKQKGGDPFAVISDHLRRLV